MPVHPREARRPGNAGRGGQGRQARPAEQPLRRARSTTWPQAQPSATSGRPQGPAAEPSTAERTTSVWPPPAQHGGQWWQQTSTGAWLRWNSSTRAWEALASPPAGPWPPPVHHGGQWWQQTSTGTWLRWNSSTRAWEGPGGARATPGQTSYPVTPAPVEIGSGAPADAPGPSKASSGPPAPAAVQPGGPRSAPEYPVTRRYKAPGQGLIGGLLIGFAVMCSTIGVGGFIANAVTTGDKVGGVVLNAAIGVPLAVIGVGMLRSRLVVSHDEVVSVGLRTRRYFWSDIRGFRTETKTSSTTSAGPVTRHILVIDGRAGDRTTVPAVTARDAGYVRAVAEELNGYVRARTKSGTGGPQTPLR